MNLTEQLLAHTPHDATETAHLLRILEFLQQTDQPFHRETLAGHITGSAIIVNDEYSHMLLLHHRKLGRWLQPGGHCDGNPDTLAVATQEAQEETGLSSIIPVAATVFDVDVHSIPLRGETPEHWHYDIRYLFVADDQEILHKADREAIALQWVLLSDIEALTDDASFQRVQAKLIHQASAKTRFK